MTGRGDEWSQWKRSRHEEISSGYLFILAGFPLSISFPDGRRNGAPREFGKRGSEVRSGSSRYGCGARGSLNYMVNLTTRRKRRKTALQYRVHRLKRFLWLGAVPS